MISDSLQEYEQPAVRPTFITVLCILTFIGSGWGLINECVKYFTAEKQAAAISMVKEKANADIQKNGKSDEGTELAKNMLDGLNTSPAKIKRSALSGGAAAVLCLAGALLMWKLKRTGFYLYVAGTALGVISPFVIFGGTNFISIFTSLIVGFVGILFVVLYGINLKYMK